MSSLDNSTSVWKFKSSSTKKEREGQILEPDESPHATIQYACERKE
jgi:hypothetical protein